MKPKAVLVAKRQKENKIAAQNFVLQTKEQKQNALTKLSSGGLCNKATINGQWGTKPHYFEYVREAKRRGLNCDVEKTTQTVTMRAQQKQKQQPMSSGSQKIVSKTKTDIEKALCKDN